jgi:hypothetical protein
MVLSSWLIRRHPHVPKSATLTLAISFLEQKLCTGNEHLSSEYLR